MRYRAVLPLVLFGLVGSLVSAQVPAGAEFRVNSFTTDLQLSPAVASNAAGDFVVVWTSLGQDGDGFGVFGQRYDASGAARGAEFQVNTHTTSSQISHSVASDAIGNFVVAWQDSGQDGATWGIFAQRFDASGVPRGSEFRVNSYTPGEQWRPSLTSDAAGNFVVVWSSNYQDGSAYGVYAQRYDAAGQPRGGEFRVNTTTVGYQSEAAVASAPSGGFVVVWSSSLQDGSAYGVFAQRYDAAGQLRGGEFQVNTYTTDNQFEPVVATDAAGNFVVAWSSSLQDGGSWGVFAQWYDATGVPRGGELQVNTYTTDVQRQPFVVADAAGSFVVAWTSYGQDGNYDGVFAQRYDALGLRRGAEFRVNTYTPGGQWQASVASDPVGNFVVSWISSGEDGSYDGIFAQRLGGLTPVALAVDATVLGSSNGNGVLEPGEGLVWVVPSWRNVNGAEQTFDGSLLGLDGPPGAGYASFVSATPIYGAVADGTVAACSDCYAAAVMPGASRPATHWDATLTERIAPDAMGQTKPWLLHVGESFTDVPRTSGYYRFIETVLHKGITGGCSASNYCPTSTSTRGQMSIFALVAKEGSLYSPPACGTTPMFADVPVTSPYCRYVEELARRGVVGGCGGGNFCPTAAVTRGQMPIFMLKTLDPALSPPACGTPMFADLPATSPYCRWAEELVRRGVVGGCGGGNYCPTSAVNRAQMAVFIAGTFGLTLYGP